MTPSRLAWCVLAALSTVAGCEGGSFDEEGFRSTRSSRSALALAQYVRDDLHHGFKSEARALLDRHFEFALGQLGEGDDTELLRSLLVHARAAGDPRIGVRVAAPSLSSELSAAAREYYDGSSSWAYVAASGATEAASERLPHEVLVFASPGSMDFERATPGTWLDVTWRIVPSGEMFAGPASIASIGQETAPIQGIAIEAAFTFVFEGSDEPTRVAATGQAREGFTYTTSYGFASDNDMYYGMVTGAFHDAMRQALE